MRLNLTIKLSANEIQSESCLTQPNLEVEPLLRLSVETVFRSSQTAPKMKPTQESKPPKLANPSPKSRSLPVQPKIARNRSLRPQIYWGPCLKLQLSAGGLARVFGVFRV